MPEENIPTTQPGPEDPGVNPDQGVGERASSGHASSGDASTSAMPQSAGMTLDGAAPDLVQAGPSRAPAVQPPVNPAVAQQITLGMREIDRANDPGYINHMRDTNPERYRYLLEVRDAGAGGLTPPQPPPPPMNGTSHVNGSFRTLNGSTPDTRRNIDRPKFAPGFFPGDEDEANRPPPIVPEGGRSYHEEEDGWGAYQGARRDGAAERIEQLQRQRERTDEDDDDDQDGEGGAE